jgi:hypothetical protein
MVMNKLPLKTYACVSSSSAIYWYSYVDATCGSACVVFVIDYSFSVSCRSIQNANVQETHAEPVCIRVWTAHFKICVFSALMSTASWQLQVPLWPVLDL